MCALISPFLGRLGRALAASWRRLGAVLARLGRVFGVSWRLLARLGRILARLGRDFDASCGHLGRSYPETFGIQNKYYKSRRFFMILRE